MAASALSWNGVGGFLYERKDVHVDHLAQGALITIT